MLVALEAQGRLTVCTEVNGDISEPKNGLLILQGGRLHEYIGLAAAQGGVLHFATETPPDETEIMVAWATMADTVMVAGQT